LQLGLAAHVALLVVQAGQHHGQRLTQQLAALVERQQQPQHQQVARGVRELIQAVLAALGQQPQIAVPLLAAEAEAVLAGLTVPVPLAVLGLPQARLPLKGAVVAVAMVEDQRALPLQAQGVLVVAAVIILTELAGELAEAMLYFPQGLLAAEAAAVIVQETWELGLVARVLIYSTP
jgi:hypothetical protein